MPSIGGLSNLQRQVRADEFRNRVMKAVAAGLVLILCAGSYFLYTRSGKRQRVMSLAVGGDQRFAVWQNSEDARQQRVQLRLQLEKGKVYHLSNDVTHRFTHHLAKAPATTDGGGKRQLKLGGSGPERAAKMHRAIPASIMRAQLGLAVEVVAFGDNDPSSFGSGIGDDYDFGDYADEDRSDWLQLSVTVEKFAIKNQRLWRGHHEVHVARGDALRPADKAGKKGKKGKLGKGGKKNKPAHMTPAQQKEAAAAIAAMEDGVGRRQRQRRLDDSEYYYDDGVDGVGGFPGAEADVPAAGGSGHALGAKLKAAVKAKLARIKRADDAAAQGPRLPPSKGHVARQRRHRGGSRDKLWAAVTQVMEGRQISAKLAPDGVGLQVFAEQAKVAVVQALHELDLLPLRMRHAFQIVEPEALAGVYPALGAMFNVKGRATYGGDVVLANPIDACKPLVDANNVTALKSYIKKDYEATLGDMDAEAEAAGVEAGATDTVDERRAEVGVLVFATRGGCSFEEKAKNAAAAGATGLVVGNDQPGPLPYMGGSEELHVPAVIVDDQTTKAVLAHLASADGGQGSMEVRILTGVDAVRAVAHPSYGRWDAQSEFRGDAAQAPGDGRMPDFLGVEYIVEDELKRRFAIFPPGMVGAGDTWVREYTVHEPVPTDLVEKFRLLHIGPQVTLDNGGVTRELKLYVDTSEAPSAQGALGAVDNDVAGQARAYERAHHPRTAHMAGGATARGMTVRESGTLYVDGATGLIVRGTLHQRITHEENEAQQLVANGTDTEALDLAARRKRKGYVNIEGDSFMKGWTEAPGPNKRGSASNGGTLGGLASDLRGGYQRQSGGRRLRGEAWLEREGPVAVAAA